MSIHTICIVWMIFLIYTYQFSAWIKKGTQTPWQCWSCFLLSPFTITENRRILKVVPVERMNVQICIFNINMWQSVYVCLWVSMCRCVCQWVCVFISQVILCFHLSHRWTCVINYLKCGPVGSHGFFVTLWFTFLKGVPVCSPVQQDPVSSHLSQGTLWVHLWDM